MSWVEEVVQQIAAETIPDDDALVSVSIEFQAWSEHRPWVVRINGGSFDEYQAQGCYGGPIHVRQHPADAANKTAFSAIATTADNLETALELALDFVSTETPVPA